MIVGDLVKYKLKARYHGKENNDKGVWLVVAVEVDETFGELITLKQGNEQTKLKQLIKEEIEEAQGMGSFLARKQIGEQFLYMLGDMYIKLINKHGLNPEEAKEAVKFEATEALTKQFDSYLSTLEQYIN
mgnify:CR=1 FL=1